MNLSISPSGTNDHGPCECCGNMSRTVWGFVSTPEETVAVYYVHWTIGRVDHGANFDLIVGKWGNGTSPNDRRGVSLAYRLLQEGPQFMIIDAAGRPHAASGLVGKALGRKEIIGTALADDVFAMVDAITAQDDRIAEILGR